MGGRRFLNLDGFTGCGLMGQAFCMGSLLLWSRFRWGGLVNGGVSLGGFGLMVFIILGLLHRGISFCYYVGACGLRRRRFIAGLG